MARRVRQQAAVQLFPFLAVLVCVMGALIFLLLVMTKRLRAVAVAKAKAALEVRAEDRPTVPLVAIELDQPAPLPPLAPIKQPEPHLLWDAAATTETHPDIAAHQQAQSELTTEWQTRVASLERQVDERQSALVRQKLLATAAERRISELRQELLQRESELAGVMGRLAAAETQLPESQLERA